VPLLIPIPAGSAVLVGRDPRPERLNRELTETLQGVPIEPVSVSSDRVSSNHLLIWNGPSEAKLYDLGSKNGSWIRLSHKAPVSFTLADEVSVELATLGKGLRISQGLKEAEWSSSEDFAPAIVRAVNDWLRQIGLNARATVQSRPPFDESEDSSALADGSRLSLTPVLGTTLDMSWRQVRDRVNAYVAEQNMRYDQLQGHDEDFVLASPLMRLAHRELSDAAAYGVRVMLLGPTGAGKERMARCYHRHSRQHRGPYVSVNCALLKEGLLYAQLFGAKRGSFTGANNDVVGVIESANDGTLFLDEVGDMDREVQKALLRFLDTRGEYQRLGDSVVRHASVQIVCATNLPLDDPDYRHARFRDDLWYRLGVKVVRIPPLCERPQDVLAFLRARTLRGGQVRVFEALSKEAVQHVLCDPLPGNFRDLENFVDRLPPNAARGTIDVEVCAAALTEGRRPKDKRSQSSLRIASVAGGSSTDWPEMFELAIAAFKDDHGETPKNWGQLHHFIEKYVKPVFVAHSCDLASAAELSKSTNYSELARRLLIADGSTVKSHLSRYLERFRVKTPSP
jgi:DNA-binding NtrC family response regulator